MIEDGVLTRLLEDMEAFAVEQGFTVYAYIGSDNRIQVVDRYPVSQDLIIAHTTPAGQQMVYRDIPKGTIYKQETQE